MFYNLINGVEVAIIAVTVVGAQLSDHCLSATCRRTFILCAWLLLILVPVMTSQPGVALASNPEAARHQTTHPFTPL